MARTLNNKWFRTAKEYLVITLGILLYTVGWSVFLTPNNLIGGGVSGISAILQYATGIKMGYTYFAINVVLLVTSFLIIGPAFGVSLFFIKPLDNSCSSNNILSPLTQYLYIFNLNFDSRNFNIPNFSINNSTILFLPHR